MHSQTDVVIPMKLSVVTSILCIKAVEHFSLLQSLLIAQCIFAKNIKMLDTHWSSGLTVVPEPTTYFVLTCF